MKSFKIKVEPIKVKSFVTNSKQQEKSKRGRNDGGYTWVG